MTFPMEFRRIGDVKSITNKLTTSSKAVIAFSTTSILSLIVMSDVVTIPVAFMVIFDSGIDFPDGNVTPLVNSTGPVPASSIILSTLVTLD